MTHSFLSPIHACYCSDPADRKGCLTLDCHLAPLKRAGRIHTWDEGRILAGQEWERERDRQFSTARLLLLLLSADFLASETGQQQIQNALRRQQAGDAVVLPLLLRACAWEQTDLRSLQILPRDHQALTTRPNADHAWQEIVAEISRVLDSLQQCLYVVSAPEDRTIAERFSQDMARSGVATWHLEHDQRSFDLVQARQAMRQASSVVLIATPAAFSSKVVKTQMELAADYQRPIQMLWASQEEETWSASSPWQAELALDARAEHYTAAQQALVAKLKHLTPVVPVSSPQQPLLREPRNPYKGLRAFTETDTHDFFGRNGLIEELLTRCNELLTQEQRGHLPQRLLAVVGASGSGKSSVIRAGLLPRLKLEERSARQEWIFLDPLTPGAHPLEALAVSLAQQPSLGDAASLHQVLASDSLRTLHVLLRQLVGSSARRVFLFLDQFEEVFMLTSSQEERVHFLDLLVTAVTEPGGPLMVVLTLRSDFLNHAIQYPALYRLLDAHHLTVFPMEREDLRQVIEQPARLPEVQLSFEGDLVGDLLFEAREQVGTLPLLEFALDQLFAHRNGHLLTLRAYREIGGVKGALARHAEATYAALPTQEHQTLARTLFLRLIEPGQIEQDATRRRAPLTELELLDPRQTTLLHETTDAFIRARLLTTNEHAGIATVEVSHEALIREWKRLATWLNETREDLALQQKITEDATQWQKHRQPNDRLYRGSQLKEARAWAKRNTPSQTEAAFLRASAKQHIRTSALILLIALFLLSMTGGAVWFVRTVQPDPTLVTTQQDHAVGSLRWAVNNAPSGATITFASSLAGKTMVLTGDLLIPTTKRLSLQYTGAGRLTISLPKNTITVDAGASLTLSNLHLLGGPSNPGSVLTDSGKLTLTNSTVSGNTASGGYSGGGGIFNSGGTVVLISSTVSGNTASGDNSGGGGIFNSGGTMTLTNSTVSGNTTSGLYGGGGIENSGTMTLTNSTVSGNTASGIGEGGGILNSGGTVMLTNSTVSGNTVVQGGGGIENSGTMTLTNSTVSGNIASEDGGGVYNIDGTMTLTNSTISGNTTSGHGGGGVYNNNGTMRLTNSTISDNTASGSGGGILSIDGGRVRLTFCTLFGNHAAYGGGLATQDETSHFPPPPGYSSIQNNLMAGNSAPQHPDVAGNLTSKGYNLIQDASGAHLQSSDLTGISLAALKIDRSLQLNGSTTTKTHALLPGSPAIDVIPLASCQIKVNDVLITTDQRGIKRPQGPECDIGAFEYVP